VRVCVVGISALFERANVFLICRAAIRGSGISPCWIRASLSRRSARGNSCPSSSHARTCQCSIPSIKRAFRLGIKKRLIYDRPAIDLLDEDNVRRGFFEPAEYRAVRKHLDEDCQAVIDFAYVTGWRKSEILNLEWPQVDFNAGFVRLEPGTTKNRRARQFPLSPPSCGPSWTVRTQSATN
jgi:integrase